MASPSASDLAGLAPPSVSWLLHGPRARSLRCMSAEESRPDAFVFCLDYADASNWDICKLTGLVGVRRNSQGQASAQAVRKGDVIYVWRGGAGRPGAGLIARVTATGPATPAGSASVPWPDPAAYTYVVPFTIDDELAESIGDSFPNNQKGVRFKIQNTALQKGLMPVSEESRLLLEACFVPAPTAQDADPADRGPVAVGRGGWTSDQDLIRAVEHEAVRVAREFLTAHGWREVRDCQFDGCGYDFIFQHSDGRERLVEVKGTTCPEVRFQLTRLEHEVLSMDPRGRVYVVTNALIDPHVHVLEWIDVEDLGLKPVSWQVG